jgi:hypothetical protein
MHRSSFVAAATSLALAVLTGVGCASTDSGGTVLDDEASDAASSSSEGGGSYASCTPSGGSLPPGQDPSKLPTCCTMGSAHCVPSADVPASFASQLATCTGGACVPDSFIEDPSLVPATCKSLDAAPGVCLSLCVPQVGTYASLLPQDVCAADERCAPCISPLNMMSTGACDIGKGTGTTCAPTGDGATGSPTADAGPPVSAQCPHEGAPVLDPRTLPSCDPNGGAHCLGASLVPTALQSQLATCPTGLCVPDVFIEAGGNFIPATCASLDGAEGRCLDETLPQVAAELSQVPQSTCQSYERCVPCYSPLDGSKTGACSLSCDPGPTKPPVLFATCCSKDGMPQGRCIPTAQVPSAEQSDLDADECTKGEALCVPSEMLPTTFTPPPCTGSSFLTDSYTGVCLSTCLDFGFFDSLAIVQGSCDDLHECAPCTNPLTGQPTGAPGCPSP